MIRRHIKTPKIKLETVAEIIELEMIRMLSYTVAGSLGCSRMPRMNEIMPATAPDINAWTCIRARLPHTSVSLVSGWSKSPKFASVENLAAKFISRFPLRFSKTGTRMKSSDTCVNTSQCLRNNGFISLMSKNTHYSKLVPETRPSSTLPPPSQAPTWAGTVMPG